MTQIHALEFNPFAENTYVVWDETGECVIFDPGCFSLDECDALKRFIDARSRQPVGGAAVRAGDEQSVVFVHDAHLG